MNATRLKRVAVLRAGGTPTVDDIDNWCDDGIPWVAIGDMSRTSVVIETERRVSALGATSKRLPVGMPGTILFAMYASVGAVAVLGVPAMWNQAILGIDPRPGFADARFLRYWLDHLKPDLGALTRSNTQDNLNAEQVGNFPFTNLSIEEQTAIADFLDAETARIDALITKKRRLIELLDERLAGSTEWLLTSQGNGVGHSKASEAPGFGAIPNHWSVRSIRSLFFLGRGRVLSHEDILANPGPYPVYSSQTAGGGVMGHIGTFAFEGEYLTWTTDGANAGTVFLRNGRFNCTNVCGTLKAREAVSCAYVRFALSQATRWFVRHDINPKLMNDVMGSIRIPIPPLAKQASIAARLTQQLSTLERFRQNMHRQVDLLMERRQALITAAVTGELAVAGVAA